MQFSISATFFALMALASAIAIEDPSMSAIRREVLLLERAGANANRPVATGACCVANQSLKEDICTTATGVAGTCIPANTANCGGALTCVATSTLTCDANVLENGRPKCRPTV